MKIRVKICGITRPQDAEAAVEAGADALGFVLWSGSPRCVTAAEAARLGESCPPYVARVGVFVDEARGFICGVARAGVTGARAELPRGLERMVGAVRDACPLPVAVGFGISSAQQVRAVGAIADGVVVGSALAAAIEKAAAEGRLPDLPAILEEEARRLFEGPPRGGGSGR